MSVLQPQSVRRLAIPHRYIFLPLAVVILASALSQYTDVNLLIAKGFFITASHHWLAAHSWLANTLLHDWGRNLIATLFLIALMVFLLGYVHPLRFSQCRKAAGYLALCIVVSTSLVGLGKKLTNVDCPGELRQFGGNAPYVHLFSHKPVQHPAGHCFPGGHSSGAFSLFALFFIFLIYWPQHARKILLSVLLLGLTYAIDQWARGAHFVIDDIWSAVIAWYVALGFYLLVFTRHRQMVEVK